MTTIKNILIIGANGQVGREFGELSKRFLQYNFILAGRRELEITDHEAVVNFFNLHDADCCVNCAAYTAVDRAEDERNEALAANAAAPAGLAKICAQKNILFIHISTDYIFNGEQRTPYKETDPPAPPNYYGESKLQGEKLVQQHNPDAIIIRTSWVYSSFGKNFVKTMLRLMREKGKVRVVNDQFGSPTNAADLAMAIMEIIQGGKYSAGIYHFCNRGVTSWYEFAKAICALSGSKCEVTGIPTSDYPTPAKRSPYSALDTTKIRKEFNLDISGWEESLANSIDKIRRNPD